MMKERFDEFIKARVRNGDWSDYLAADRRSLSRQRILEVCQFSRSILYQNAEVRKGLSDLENQLREEGVIISLYAPINFWPLADSSFDEDAAKLAVRLDMLHVQRAVMLASMDEARRYIRDLTKE